MSADLAIVLRQGDLPGTADSYGRLIANRGLYSALVRHGGYDTVHWLTGLAGLDDSRLIDRLQQLLGLLDEPPDPERHPGRNASNSAPRFRCHPPLATDGAVQAGTLLHGSAYLAASAWQRRHAALERRYSLVGTFFGIAVAQHREAMLGALLAPLHPWDAVICSSPTVQQAVRGMLNNVGAYLAERTGSRHLPLPQLPVIPIGVDAPSMARRAADHGARRELRDQLGLDDGAVAVLWVGRLSWHDKAFPQPMFLALEQASWATSVPIHFLVAGWFPNPERDRSRFEEAARLHAPSVVVHWLDGNDQGLLARCWAAADVFLSLSDTILETFGQAPVEAMAAGLPVVLSDWDGYRSLLRDGEEGLLVPSLIAPAGGNGEWLALLQEMRGVDQEGYGGSVAQHVAIHVGRAAEALAALIRSPDLRRRLGAAAQRKARASFDWPVVVAAHQELFAALAERRGGALDAVIEPQPIQPRQLPLPALGNDPFADFAGYASAVLSDATTVRCTPLQRAAVHEPFNRCRLDGLLPGLRATPEEHRQLLALLGSAGASSVADLLAAFPSERHPFLRMSLVWLAKLGLLDWLPDAQASSSQGSPPLAKATK